MKRTKTILVMLIIVCLLTMLPFPALAVSNPYPATQDVYDNGEITVPCTRYAWQQAYEHLGVALPAWSDAINWYDAAANAGYSVGTTPRANSIAVWSVKDHTHGHVAFVTAVNGDYMTVNEGGRSGKPESNGVVNGEVLPSTVNSYWYGRTLKGFIYLSPNNDDGPHVHNYNTFEFYWSEHPHYNCYSCACGAIDANYSEPVYLSSCAQCKAETSANLSWAENEGKHSVGSTNAVLAGIGNMSGADISVVSKVGIYLYDYKGTQLAHKTESVSFDRYSYFEIWYDVNDELGYTLSAGTPYKYKFVAIIGDKTYDSPLYTFTTTGTHSHKYDSGKVTANPTCGKEGSKVYTCMTCGGTKTESIAKLTNHSYNSGAVTKQPTCKDTGVKTYTCTVCGGTKTETIAKLTTHSYDGGKVTKTATCKEAGVKTYTCTVCGTTKTETIAKLTTHSYDNGQVTKAATCKEDGIKTFTCTVCGATKTEGIAKLTSHNYDNGTVTKEATCKEDGVKTYTCTICGDTKAESIAKLTTHSYSDGVCTVCGDSDSNYVPPTEPTEPAPTEPTPTEPDVEPTEPEEPDEEKPLGFFEAIAVFFEAIFRVLFWFLYL